MKKATFLLAMMTMLLWLRPGTAEAQLSYGVKGGLNLTSMKLNNDLLKASNRTGFFVGPTVRLKTGAFISFDLSALYNERSFRVSENYTDAASSSSETGETVYNMVPASVKPRAIDVPLNLRLKFGWVYLAAGPQLTFNFNDKIDLGSGEWYQKTFNPKTSTFSINFGAGVSIGHVEVGVTYNIACDNTGDISYQKITDGVRENVKLMDSKQNVWQLMAAFYF